MFLAGRCLIFHGDRTSLIIENMLKEARQNPGFPTTDLKPYAGDMREQGIFAPQRFKKGSLVGAWLGRGLAALIKYGVPRSYNQKL